MLGEIMSGENGGVQPQETPVSGEDSANEVIDSIESASQQAQDEGHITEDVSDDVDVEDASDEELEDVLDDDSASDVEKQEAKKELTRRLKLKIRGEERELDLSNDDDIALLQEMAQKGEGADSKFQEAATMRKQMEKLADLLQKNPMEALKRIGHDPEELAQKYVERRLEEMKLSPEQKRIKELEERLAKEEEAKKELEQKKQEQEKARLEEQYARKIDEDITSALEKSKLPRSAYVVDRIVNTMAAAIENGYEDVSVADVVPYVEEKMVKELQEMYDAMPEEVIEQLLGKNTMERMRKRRINRAKKKVASPSEIKPTGETEVKKAREAQEREDKALNSKDFFKNIGSY